MTKDFSSVFNAATDDYIIHRYKPETDRAVQLLQQFASLAKTDDIDFKTLEPVVAVNLHQLITLLADAAHQKPDDVFYMGVMGDLERAAWGRTFAEAEAARQRKPHP